MMNEQIKVPAKLLPVFNFTKHPYGSVRYRGAYGGRGSGKSVTFTKMSLYVGMWLGRSGYAGVILCARQFMNSLEDSSLEDLKHAIRESKVLSAYWEFGERYVRSRDGTIHYVFTGLDRNIDSVKSKSKILLCLIEEAEQVQEKAWVKLLPTVRSEGSEVWVIWNPETDGSATDLRFKKEKYELIVEVNWRDNPWFPKVLNDLRLEDLRLRASQYDYIWEGAYKTVSDDPLFTFNLPTYKEIPMTLYRHTLRIDTAMKGGKRNDFHGYSLNGYCFKNDFELLNESLNEVNIPFSHAANLQNDYTFLLDAGRWSCGFPDLVDNIVELVKHIGNNMLPRETFDGIVIEDANVGSALCETLREHKKLNDWGAVNIGLTPKYKNKFARANESVVQLQQGKLLVPVGVNRYSNRFTDIGQFNKEFKTFTETDTHASDDILDPVLWEVVTKHGAAPRTRWN